MKASVLYRIASVLLVLFAVGHTLGFRMTDPKLGVDAIIASLQTLHFQVQGFSRTFGTSMSDSASSFRYFSHFWLLSRGSLAVLSPRHWQ